MAKKSLGVAPDISNVVPFASRTRTRTPERPAPEIVVETGARPPAAIPTRYQQTRLAVLLATSLAAHGGLIAIVFMREPAPHASIGLEVVSVELVLGANAVAGLEAAPSESDISSAASPIDQKQEVQKKTTPADEAASKDQNEQQIELVQQEQKPSSAQRQRATPPSSQSVASNSVGRGRSDPDSNYAGRVSAHLARHKRFPEQARSRGEHGTATVTFRLDGGGHVSSVQLAHGSGAASIDQEAQALIRRASPFPAPPSGQPVTFTVPVQFNLR